MEKSKVKRSIFKSIFSGFFLILVFCVIQIYDYSKIERIALPKINDESDLNWDIDSISNENRFIAISGWAFIPDEKPENFTINIILKNRSTQEAFLIPTVLNVREDLRDATVSDIDYSQAGFSARLSKVFLDLDNYAYNIYVQYISANTQITILTDQLLGN